MQRLVCLAALLVPAVLHGQRLPPMPHSVANAVAGPVIPFRVDTTRAIPKTYWLEGGVIGGVAMGMLVAIAAHDLGEGDTSAAGYTGAFIIGAGVGFPVGALIGGQFPKH